MRSSLTVVFALLAGTSPLFAQTELVDVSPKGRRCRNADFPKNLAKAADLVDLASLLPALQKISAPSGSKLTVTAFYRETGAFANATAIASSLDSAMTESLRAAVAAAVRDTEEPGPWAVRLLLEWKGDEIGVKSNRPQLCYPAPIRGEEAPTASRRRSRSPQGGAASTSRRTQRRQRRMIAHITVSETGEVTEAELISGPPNLNRDDFERMWMGRKLQPALLDGRAIPYVWQPR